MKLFISTIALMLMPLVAMADEASDRAGGVMCVIGELPLDQAPIFDGKSLKFADEEMQAKADAVKVKEGRECISKRSDREDRRTEARAKLKASGLSIEEALVKALGL